MRAAIYNPYLDTLGGGERYTMAFAKVLLDAGYEVDVEWNFPAIKNKLEQRFGINLEGINFVADIKRGDAYDVCFWVSDGSIPALKARKNFLHFQVPFHDVGGGSLLNKMKLFRINKIICNSAFTKSYIDSEYGVSSLVVYPPVDTQKVKPKKKENFILSVGRFSQLIQAKRQDVLIKAFKRLNKVLPDWRLVLGGGAEVGGREFVKKLKKASTSYPIDILTGPSFKEIADLYGRAKIFWSASGFGPNPKSQPEKLEHFGINVVEAMAAGAAPIVFSAGGHKEIISDGVNGFLWEKTSQLLKKTLSLASDKILYKRIVENSLKASRSFSYEVFSENVKKIL